MEALQTTVALRGGTQVPQHLAFCCSTPRPAPTGVPGTSGGSREGPPEACTLCLTKLGNTRPRTHPTPGPEVKTGQGRGGGGVGAAAGKRGNSVPPADRGTSTLLAGGVAGEGMLRLRLC